MVYQDVHVRIRASKMHEMHLSVVVIDVMCDRTVVRWSGDQCAGLETEISGFESRPRHLSILFKGVNLQVPRPTKPFILPGSMNWYQLRLGVKVHSAASGLQERRSARLAAGVPAMGPACRRPPSSLLRSSFIPVACQRS